ncbi:MAG: ABC transporter permease [Clostridia bacterium]|nr:ABC transporter permease [Clostridia bacterium]
MNQPPSPRSRKWEWVKPWIGIVVVLVIWTAVSNLGILNTYVLPSPQQCYKAFRKMLLSGELGRDILISFQRVLRGFSIAFLLAFLIGALKILVPASAGFYEHIIQFFRNVPPLSMIPLLILWCGIRETTKTVIIVLASFFPMYLSIVKGFTQVDPGLIEVGKTFRFSAWKRFYRILLPSALSDILVGMRTGLGYAWRAIIGAEMIAASTGLGHLILFSQQTSRTDKVIVGIFVIGTVGYVTDRLFGFLIRKFFGRTARNGWD